VLLGGALTSITALNYIDILQGRKEYDVVKARDNALFALNLAIEKLQRLSGQDTCMTANAGIVATVDGGKKHYSGVWMSSGSKNSGSPKFLEWLVSSGDSETFDSIYSEDLKNSIKILSAGNCEDITVTPVAVKENGKVVGQYGFWISDESQKIKLNLVDRYKNSSSFLADQVRYSCPQTFDLEPLCAKHHLIKNSPVLLKIDFPEQLKCIDGEVFRNFRDNRHSLTLHSYGILCDSKRGGLRQDLSTLAHDSKMALGNDCDLFERQTDLPAYVPRLNFVLSFFRLPEKYHNGKMSVFASNPMFHPQIYKDYTGATASNPGADLQPPTVHGIYPLLVQANLNIGVARFNGKFAMTFTPQIVLWNPYNTDLKMTDYTIELCAPYDDMALTLLAEKEGTQHPLMLKHALSQKETVYCSKILKFRLSTELKAGEVRTFSLASNQEINISDGNKLLAGDSISNFIYIDTNVSADEYSKIELRCTDSNGSVNLHWNCLSWRLEEVVNGKILQEIAELDPVMELDPAGDATLTAKRDLTDKNINCFSLTVRMKCEMNEDISGKQGVRWLANCNPRAQCINRAVCQEYASPFLTGNFAPGNWNFFSSISNFITPRKINSEMNDYLRDLILFDVPDNACKILNIGYLRHVNFLPFGYFSSQIFGSSRASPLIPLNKTFHENLETGIWPSRARVESLYDYSYLLNDVMFDGYFVSTLSLGTKIGEDANCLANRRFKLLSPDRLIRNDNLAQVLLIDGVFNVNTYSSSTWQCVLSSVKNANDCVVFPRFYSRRMIDKTPAFDTRHMELLSTRLSTLIRGRMQPFACIGEFVNRTIHQDAIHCTKAGVLQMAIDESHINAAREHRLIGLSKNLSIYDDSLAGGYLEENLPSVVNQGDILQTTSHFLCTRGDTFLIRAFGDHVDNRGKLLQRTYCEAIVQRMPEYVNDTENSPTDSEEKLSGINKKFGRRYKIILFRWLDQDEI
jgi:hypothetical protein